MIDSDADTTNTNRQSNGTCADVPKTNGGSVAMMFDGKPREEHTFDTFYPDLSDTKLLPVFVVPKSEQTNGTVPKLSSSGNSSAFVTSEFSDSSNKVSDGQSDPKLNKPVFEVVGDFGSPPSDVSDIDSDIDTNPQDIIPEFTGNVTETTAYSQLGDETHHIRDLEADMLVDSVVNSYLAGESLSRMPIPSFRWPVLYDMDEQDEIFLQQLNRKFGYFHPNAEDTTDFSDTTKVNDNSDNLNPQIKPRLTRRQLELALSILETCYISLERRMGAKLKPSTLQTLRSDHRPSTPISPSSDVPIPAPQTPLPDDGTFFSPQDQTCAVCGESECDNANAIVFCDGCDLAVHQECYGVAFIPEGQWLCRKCHLLRGQPAECIFCPNTGGALKQTEDSRWGHLLCALWIPELSLGNSVYLEPILGTENIPKSRWKLVCSICRYRVGAPIQCSNKNCFKAYHVTCARYAGLYLQMEFGVSGAVSGAGGLTTFCEKHCPETYLRDNHVMERLAKAREYYAARRQLEAQQRVVEVNARHKRKRRRKWRNCDSRGGNGDGNTELGLEIPWKTPSGIPIIPNFIYQFCVDAVRRAEVAGPLKFCFSDEECREIIAEICKYWTLKRELKRGAPLVRGLEPLKYEHPGLTMVKGAELKQLINGPEKDEFRKIVKEKWQEDQDLLTQMKNFGSEVFVEDLSKLSELTELILEEQRVKLEEFTEVEEVLAEKLVEFESVAKVNGSVESDR